MKFTVYHLQKGTDEKSLHVNIDEAIKDNMANVDSLVLHYLHAINMPLMDKWSKARHAFISVNSDTLPAIFQCLQSYGWLRTNDLGQFLTHDE